MTNARVTKHNVDICQGQDEHGHDFGYVAGDEGGFFFTWMPTLKETLESIEEDDIDGGGGLDKHEVRKFLADYLPTGEVVESYRVRGTHYNIPSEIGGE
jgi:hypothetical protein